MSSTNKTTNYDLSQYIGSDKPTYLSDYNGDMYKIDAQMKVNADNIATAISSASTATSTANSAVSTANSASSDAASALSTANSASTTAGNAQSTANSALSTATAAQTTANSANSKAEAIASKLNLTSFETIAYTSFTKTGGGTLLGGTVYTAANGDGSIAKIYGQYDVKTNNASGTVTIPTQLRPKDSNGAPTDLTVNGVVIRSITSGSTVVNNAMLSATIRSNGNVEIDYTAASGSDNNCRIMIMASVLFLTPFDDQPITPDA